MPVDKAFYLQGEDAFGYSEKAFRNLEVKENNADNYFEKVLRGLSSDVSGKLWVSNILLSNFAQPQQQTNTNSQNQENQEKEEELNVSKILQASAEALTSFLSAFENERFGAGKTATKEDLDAIIASLVLITKQPQITQTHIPAISNAINFIANNFEFIVSYIRKIELAYRVLDNLLLRCESSAMLRSDEDLIEKVFAYANFFNEKLYAKALNGQNILKSNSNYDSQLNKMSSRNIKQICVNYRDPDFYFNLFSKKSKAKSCKI